MTTQLLNLKKSSFFHKAVYAPLAEETKAIAIYDPLSNTALFMLQDSLTFEERMETLLQLYYYYSRYLDTPNQSMEPEVSCLSSENELVELTVL